MSSVDNDICSVLLCQYMNRAQGLKLWLIIILVLLVWDILVFLFGKVVFVMISNEIREFGMANFHENYLGLITFVVVPLVLSYFVTKKYPDAKDRKKILLLVASAFVLAQAIDYTFLAYKFFSVVAGYSSILFQAAIFTLFFTLGTLLTKKYLIKKSPVLSI